MYKFHTRLKRLREEKELTIREMSALLGMPESTYRQWEHGAAIKGEPYVKLAEILEVSLMELLTGERPSRKKIFQYLDEMKRNMALLEKEISSL